MSTLWTIGHSTRPIEKFLELLRVHGIELIFDVRTIPQSRFNPQFHSIALAERAIAAELGYRHAAHLGGLRKPKQDSPNLGWRNQSFRGYADYMQTESFRKALEQLMVVGTSRRTAVMCAEAVPWRCHRSLIADALLCRGWTVRHILSETKAVEHHRTSFAILDRGTPIYPRSSDSEAPIRLF